MKRILIVGASRGIGLGLVRRYLEGGWQVVATTRTPDDPGELERLSGELAIHPFEVRDDPAPLIAAVGQVDAVIHNAGVGRGTPRSEMMAVNAEAPIRVAQAVIDSGSLRRGGKVAIITSQLGARLGDDGPLGDYGDSKAALNDEFRLRAGGWAEQGVLAIVVHPGWVRTDMGGPHASLSIEESADGVFTLMEGLTPDQHGRFWTWDGREHSW